MGKVALPFEPRDAAMPKGTTRTPLEDRAAAPNAVPKVNLTDASVEPSDKDLAALMRDFQREVAERESARRAALRSNLLHCLQEAKARLGRDSNAQSGLYP